MGIINYIIDKFFSKPVPSIVYGDKMDGKVIIVTGASRGLGRSLASRLYQMGGKLVLVSRDIAHLEHVFSPLDKRRSLLLQADIKYPSSAKLIAKEAISRFGRVDVLINNAGVYSQGHIENVNESDYDTLMDTNVKGMFFLAKEIIPIMKKQGTGLIINLGSKISHRSSIEPEKILYATTKYAVEGFSKSLQNELQKFGIRVSCIMPATINTIFTPNSHKYLNKDSLARLVEFIICNKEVNIDSIVIQSPKQII